MLLAAGYALFSGWGVPAQRTVWMLATVALLRLSGRRWPWPQVWLLACAVVVTVDPWALLQPGFWLSFVAVGVLFATDLGRPAAERAGPIRRAAARVGAMLREQWVVTLALTPLTLLLFGQVSLVGLLANAAGDSLGDAGDHAAGHGRRGAAAAVGTGGLGRAGAGGVPALAGGVAVRHRVDARAAAVGRRGGRARRLAAGDAAAVARAPAGLAAAAAGAAVAGAAAGAGAVRAAGGRHRPGQRGDRAHRHPHAGVRQPARATARKATPAIACWCRCCGRWTSGWTP